MPFAGVVHWDVAENQVKLGDLIWVHNIRPMDICDQFPALAVVVREKVSGALKCVFLDPTSYKHADDPDKHDWYPDTVSLVEIEDLTPEQVVRVARWRLRLT